MNLLGLSREDFICLLKGKFVGYSVMDHPLISQNGSYSGSYDRWDWKWNALEKNTDEELEVIYKILSNKQFTTGLESFRIHTLKQNVN